LANWKDNHFHVNNSFETEHALGFARCYLEVYGPHEYRSVTISTAKIEHIVTPIVPFRWTTASFRTPTQFTCQSSPPAHELSPTSPSPARSTPLGNSAFDSTAAATHDQNSNHRRCRQTGRRPIRFCCDRFSCQKKAMVWLMDGV
jgi:hypothetical protein